MPVRDMPGFVLTHKEVRYAVICSLISCFLLIAQLILMDKNALDILFDVIIPITAAGTFGCYAITMAYDRPVILICPPTMYFDSMLVNQLIKVEVGVGDTYPYVILAELIPFIFFCVSVSTDKLKKLTSKILRIACVLLVLGSIAVFVLSAFFRITVFHSSVNYMKSTFGMMCSMFSVLFIYWGMDNLLVISGTERKKRANGKKSTAKISDVSEV